MHAGLPADRGVVAYFDVAGELSEIAHRHAVSEYAVVRDVSVRQQQAVVAHRGNLVVSGSSLNADVFPHHRPASNAREGSLSRILAILRRSADRCEGKDLALFADLGPAINDDVRLQHGPGTD